MCEPKPGAALGGVARAVAVAVGVVLGVAVVKAAAPLAGVLPVITLAILGVCAAGVVVLYRVVRYGRLMRPVERSHYGERITARREMLRALAEVPGGRLMIEGKVIRGEAPQGETRRRAGDMAAVAGAGMAAAGPRPVITAPAADRLRA